MAWRRYCCGEVVPFLAMVVAEFVFVGLNTLFKAASSKGLSEYVFIFNSFATATLFLLPFAAFSHKGAGLPPFKVSVLLKVCLLGLITYVRFQAQLTGFKGVEYSSPTLSSAIGNLTPAFTFMLAITFRLEKLILTSSSTQAKITGTFVSISGAFLVVLYKDMNFSDWKTTTGIALVAILYSGLMGYCFGTIVHTWGVRVKGPVYVALFKPFSIVIAAVTGFIFLGESLYLGCVVGAVVISVGFYIVMWGKAKEEMGGEFGVINSLESPYTPLLGEER
ncbi:EamA-like transporter family [Actinidia rufa]|uniref:EamA-like transporter family n=1 Tax=Actinidia rufa TaxID=165716 RepID=A0A7J0DXY1_9ERIC|nr:EamA-like transporter family [Actinidia rufa]